MDIGDGSSGEIVAELWYLACACCLYGDADTAVGFRSGSSSDLWPVGSFLTARCFLVIERKRL